MDIRPLSADLLADFHRLFACSPTSDHCQCIWFIKSVRAFHADGKSGNSTDFARERTEVLLAPKDHVPLVGL